MDIIKYNALVERTNVAKNQLEIRNNPNVEFFVEDLETQAKELELIADLELEAMEKFSETSAKEKKGIFKILTSFDKIPMRGIDNLSETIVKAELYKRLKSDPKKFIQIATDKNLSIRILVAELLENGELTKKSNYYIYEGESLGSSIEGVIEFFKDPKNQSIKIAASKSIANTPPFNKSPAAAVTLNELDVIVTVTKNSKTIPILDADIAGSVKSNPAAASTKRTLPDWAAVNTIGVANTPPVSVTCSL